MSFINSYKISSEVGVVNNTYTTSICKEFNENGTSYIYTVTRSANEKCVILKTDSGGNVVWSKEIADFNIDLAHFTIEQTSSSPIQYTTVVNGETSPNGFIYFITFDVNGTIVSIKKITVSTFSGQEDLRVQYYNNHFFLAKWNEVYKVDTNGDIQNIWSFSNGQHTSNNTYSFYIDPSSGEMLFFHLTTTPGIAYLVLRDQNFSTIEEVKVSYQSPTSGAYPADAVFTKISGVYHYVISVSSGFENSIQDVCLIKTQNGSIIYDKILQYAAQNPFLANFTIVNNHVYYNSVHGVIKLSLTDLSAVWVKKLPGLERVVRLVQSSRGDFTGSYNDFSLGSFSYNCKVFCLGQELESCITQNEPSPISGITDYIDFSVTTDYTSNTEFLSLLSVPVTSAVNDVVLNTGVICNGTGDGIPNLNTSTITANPGSIQTNGTDTSVITVQLKDSAGIDLTTGVATVVITQSSGILTTTTNNGDGTYTANLTTTDPGSAILSFTIDGALAMDTAAVKFIASNVGVPITTNSVVQSPYLYLQAAGSQGIDSTKGIHLRWLFAGTLGEKHLPKRNYATNSDNFNKPNDVVTVYRVPYQKVDTTLDLTAAPDLVDDLNRVWVYKYSGGADEFHVYFKNQTVYDQVRGIINPMLNTAGFFDSYGDQIIEIEAKKKLFFALEVDVANATASSSLQVETLSVPKNEGFSFKSVSSRQTYDTTAELSQIRLVCEQGRSIRYKASSCRLSALRFEFYSDFITEINNTTGWLPIGEYGLTHESTDDAVFEMLEPVPNLVHGHWQRFNDDDYVNIHNYRDKWNGNSDPMDTEEWNRDLKQMVGQYITLSDDPTNPTATAYVDLDNDPDLDDEDRPKLEVSYLDLLNVAAYDYHMARMLGLGTLDYETAVHTGDFVYLAEYTSTGNLEDGLGARDVKHLSMSLPTSINDERLPLAVDIKEIQPGAFLGSDGEGVDMTDEDGYLDNGESRYVSIYAEEQPADLLGASFFETSESFSAHEYTYPIYAGLEYQYNETSMPAPYTWQKPELAHDQEYRTEGTPGHYETDFLTIPEDRKPLYVHRQSLTGFHYYCSYGINLFSRSTLSTEVKHIETLLTPKNPLLPPSNIFSLLVKEEQPRFMTSQEDQDRLAAITTGDKTLVRLNFEYNSAQDLITRQIPQDSTATHEQILDPTNRDDASIFYPDNKEIYAKEIDVFFRNELPQNVSGRVLSINDHPSEIHISVIETGEYELISVGETITPTITPGTEGNYVGGVFNLGNQSFIIQSVTSGTEGPIFNVYKKEISDGIITNITPENEADLDGTEELITIEEGADPLFMAIENMQNASSWGTSNPLPLAVQTFNHFDPDSDGDEIVFHREVIEVTDEDGNTQKFVEKSRGIWSNPSNDHTTVEEEEVPFKENYDVNGNFIGYETRFEGDYKITFHGVSLYEHPQYHGGSLDSVNWQGGTVRLHTYDSYNPTTGVASATRKVLKVTGIEKIVYQSDGADVDLIIYAYDSTFPIENLDDDDNNDVDYDFVRTGSNVSANYYPGYQVYLYDNATYGLTETDLEPATPEATHYAIFGFRSRDITSPELFKSKISVPSLIFNQGIIEPAIPELPTGSLYATRPDFFGKSSYSIETEFTQKPHGVLFYRSNDEALLNALYSKTTIATIRAELEALGGNNEEYFADRWKNFLDLDLLAPSEDPTNNDFADYTYYPLTGAPEDQYKFPNPDKPQLFEWANGILERLNNSVIDPPATPFVLFNTNDPVDDPNSDLGKFVVGDRRIFGFVKGAIYNAFVPMTQVPIIYDYIKDHVDYKPVNKKQVIKDKNGYVLAPTHPDFDMAPMAKVTNTSPHTVQFVDFNLDGTSNNIYFYGVKETGSQMKMGDFSPFLGPIKLVNTNPPEQPEIKRIMPVLENQVLEIQPAIQLEVNSYPGVQNIHQLHVYRAMSMLDAKSIRTMKLVNKIDLVEEDMLSDDVWKVLDTFDDLTEVPYNEGLFYRVTASRKVEYTDKDGNVVTEYQPSQPSKIVASMMVEVETPTSPTLDFTSDPIDTSTGEILNAGVTWEKTCYNGKYHLYKMNPQGTWKQIHTIQSNDTNISVALADTTLTSGGTLKIVNEDNNPIYHHFKVTAENSSGMISTEEYILSVYQEFDEETGIGRMVIGSSFVIN